MTSTLLCGAFGQGNPGDDALLDAFARALHGHDLLVTSPGPPGTGGHVAPTAAGVGRALLEAGAVVVGGGTVFKTLHPASGRPPHALLLRTAALVTACRARDVPVALVGVGAGDLRTRRSRSLAAHIARHADLVVLRDEESAAVLSDCGVAGPFRIGADAAWTVLDAPVPAARRGALVVVSHLVHRRADRAAGLLSRVVDSLLARGLDVVLEPWQPADVELARKVCERDRDAPVTLADRPVTLADTVQRAARSEVVVSARFHGLVAAGTAGTPALAIAHEPKLAGLARRLDQPSVPPHATAAVVDGAVHGLLATAPPTPSAVDAERVAAADAMRLLRLVVSGGGEDDVVDLRALALSDGVPW
ncbi:MAG TPA: polysaccharide pyruvyl transferase family protein [Acidimicrobiales bacterium]|nr:polysaccharide pyruvyl transferase family protein [Acidimicrobiales bacterium]